MNYRQDRAKAIENLHKRRLAVESMVMSLKPLPVINLDTIILDEARRRMARHLDLMVLKGYK